MTGRWDPSKLSPQSLTQGMTFLMIMHNDDNYNNDNDNDDCDNDDKEEVMIMISCLVHHDLTLLTDLPPPWPSTASFSCYCGWQQDRAAVS